MSITIHTDQIDKAQHKLSKSKFSKIWSEKPTLPKPSWLRMTVKHNDKVTELKSLLRDQKLVTVCEEASCPNLPECFGHGTATFMIMGDKCTRRCSFCDVAHGRPDPLDRDEPQRLAETIKLMQLNYVVITSVDRDDLKDGGGQHFSECIRWVRTLSPETKIEILVPDFRKRQEIALGFISTQLPDVFNHNIETVPRLYKEARPGSDYQISLNLIESFKKKHPHIPTKSGIMVGMGESIEELLSVLKDLRQHGCDWLTVGQYLQPSSYHLPVHRYVEPAEFELIAKEARQLGFEEVASGPFVRSSYKADQMVKNRALS